MKLILPIFCAFLFATTTFAQTDNVPRFESYPAQVYKGRIAPVKISSPEARTFHTRLREGAKAGVNFAGHYTVVEWGCGAGCLQVGIIDAKTGVISFTKELAGFMVWFWGNEDYDALQFKPNSRLIILSGSPATEGDNEGAKTGLFYYEWTGSGLKLIKYVEKKREAAH